MILKNDRIMHLKYIYFFLSEPYFAFLSNKHKFDQLHLIDGEGNLIQSASNSPYTRISDKAIKMVLNVPL